jgi:acyl-coenzyme A thioesterase PaaI-like protein
VKDWTSLEAAALAMRRLNRAVAGFDAADEDWRELARHANEMANRLEAGAPRAKEHDVLTVPHGIAARDGLPLTIAVGERFDFDPFSAGGGRFHPSSIGMTLWRDGDESVAARTTIDPMFQGPPGRVHGGVVALIIDEVMGAVNRFTGGRAYTARLAVDLRAPAPVGVELRFRAWRELVNGRKITIRADGRSDEGLFVEAEALFVAPVIGT